MRRPKPIEKSFEKSFNEKIKKIFPGIIIKKLHDSQGIPDRLYLYGSKWATLEFKRSATEKHQPNQDWYVDAMNKWSFSRFIFPENKDEVLQALIDFFSGQERTDKK